MAQNNNDRYTPMKIFLILLAIAVIAVLLFVWISLRKVQISEALMASTEPFQMQSDNFKKTMLVLGDSTGVGVGATRPEESVPGLVAKEVGATYVENQAVSGAQVPDVQGQIGKTKLPHYAYIVLQVGANDVTHFHDIEEVSTMLKDALVALPPHDHLVVLMAGNVGAASAFPWFIKPYYTKQTLRYHAAFADIVSKAGGRYVDLYIDPKIDPFVREPKVYLAIDGFHPSSAGYALWFERIKQILST